MMTKEEILNAIGDAGIVGMGGAGFPTKVKLSPKEPDKIDYIIHCASITTSKIMISRPVDVIRTSLNGTENLLELAKEYHSLKYDPGLPVK